MTQHSRSLIGAQTRIEGSIAFTGTLQTDGRIDGDVSCKSPADGVVVVGRSGHIAGSIIARQVVVGGEVSGNVSADGNIEIHDGARVNGDISYRGLEVMPGSSIEGRLIPMSGAADQPSPRPSAPAPSLPAFEAAGAVAPSRRPQLIAVGVAVVGLLAWFFWPQGSGRQDPVPPVPSPVTVNEPPTPAAPVERTEAMERPAVATPVPAAAAVEPAPVAVPAPTSAPPVPAQTQPSPAAVPVAAPPAPLPAASERVTTIRGDSADKAADMVYIVAQDAAIVARKKRNAAGDGTAIDMPAGSKKRLPIARDEILRVVEGERLEIFYQGRKVMPGSFRGGAWLEFVPADGR